MRINKYRDILNYLMEKKKWQINTINFIPKLLLAITAARHLLEEVINFLQHCSSVLAFPLGKSFSIAQDYLGPSDGFAISKSSVNCQ